MANIMRWRYGDTNPVMIGAAADAVIEIGDFVCQTNGVAEPASACPDSGSEGGNQESFHDVFLGIAMQCSPAGSTEPIRVATTGVFEFDCLSTTLDIGDLIGPDEDAGGTALANQLAAKVADASKAVGRCVKRVNPAGTRVLVEVLSAVVHGGAQEII